jgi:glycosyltransferase involved in cell wall biosynthesis
VKSALEGSPSGSDGQVVKVSVVIPTLNEARNLPHVLKNLPPTLYEVIVVDGHSVDDTVATVMRLRPDARILTQTRSGKGNALACGFAAATGDVIVMVDADGSADPAEIPQFVSALTDGADFAKGTRFSLGGGSSDITRMRRAGNLLLSSLVNMLCRTGYTDLCYGYNAFWRRHVPVLGLDAEAALPGDGGTRLWGDGFEVETLINIRVAQAGLTVREVASYEHPRLHGVSNLNTFSDGLRVLRTIFAEHFYAKKRTAFGQSSRLAQIPEVPPSGALLEGAWPAAAIPAVVNLVSAPEQLQLSNRAAVNPVLPRQRRASALLLAFRSRHVTDAVADVNATNSCPG